MIPVRFSSFCRPLNVLIAGVFVLTLLAPTSDLFGQDKVSFVNDIKPIFEKHCIRCHGPEEQDGEVRVDMREEFLENEIEAGDPDWSDLYIAVSSEDKDQMMPPPNEGGPLEQSEIELIRNWITQGAEWPEDVTVNLIEEVVEEVKEQVAAEEKAKDAKQNNLELATQVTGLLHPMILHFPVALIIGGAFFALFGFRGESPLSDAAYYCLWLGALTAILACVSGWFFAVDKNMTDWQKFDINESIDVHRWGGIVVAAIAFMLALIAASSRRRDPYGTGAFWKFSLILLAGLTGYVAHHGGKMTHDGLHEKLINKTTQLKENLTGEKKKAPALNAEDPAEPKTDDSADESPGATDDDKGKKSAPEKSGI